jgi:3-hydroxyacyl-[acyl-carrier-protein] dehydratase
LKKIKNEIEQHMTVLASEGGTLTARFVFPEEFVGFQGHFPAKKILPGVCQVQCALSTLERANKKAVVLKEIMLAKYLAPVLPGEELTCVCSELQEKNGEFIVKAVITKDSSRVSEFKLRVSFTEGNSGR